MCFDDGQEEPDDFYYKLDNDLTSFFKEKDINYIHIECDNPKDYYTIINNLHSINDDINVYGTSREGKMEIVIDVDNNQEIESDVSQKEDSQSNESDEQSND